MKAAIPSGLTDDNDFVELFNSMLTRLLAELAPQKLWVIQIDNWFDHKWLRFSGNGAVASNIPMDRLASVKVEFHQDKLTFPPFSPNRVLGQWSFVRSGDSYVEAPLLQMPHSTERRSSNLNLHRRAETADGSALFVWYSGNTLKNGRGSVMVYSISDSEPVCWFASFGRSEVWSVKQTKNVDREYVLSLLPSAAE
jgi:hypothetical protein